MMEIELLTSLFLPITLGLVIIYAVLPRKTFHPLFCLALSYGLGAGILTLWMFLMDFFKMAYSVETIGIPLWTLLIVIFLLYFKSIRHRKSSVVSQTPQLCIKPDSLTTAVVIYIAYFTIYVFWRSLNVPIISWDAIATVAFKGKIIFFEKSLALVKDSPHANYPLFVPLFQNWIAYNIQDWNDQLLNIIFPLAFLSFLVITYFFLREYTSIRWSTLGCALLVSSNMFSFHATISYQEFFMLYYNCATIMLLILWSKRLEFPLLLLASFFAGFTCFVKLEGFPYFLIHICVMLLILSSKKLIDLKNKIKHILIFVCPAIIVLTLINIFQYVHQIPFEHRAKLSLTANLFERLIDICEKLFVDLFWSGNWSLIWFLLALSLLRIQRIRQSLEVQILFLSLTLFFIFIISIALFTNSYFWVAGEASSTVLSRLILHFFPLSALLIVLINAPAKVYGR